MKTSKKVLVLKIIVLVLIGAAMVIPAIMHIITKYDLNAPVPEQLNPVELVIMLVAITVAMIGVSFIVLKLINPEPKN